MNGFTIGKVATGAGVGIETIRFYEREGLIAKPPRGESSGYRHYPEDEPGFYAPTPARRSRHRIIFSLRTYSRP